MLMPHAGSEIRSGFTDAGGFFIVGTVGSAGSGLVDRWAAGVGRENSRYTGAPSSGLGWLAADVAGGDAETTAAEADADAVGTAVGVVVGGVFMGATFTFTLEVASLADTWKMCATVLGMVSVSV